MSDHVPTSVRLCTAVGRRLTLHALTVADARLTDLGSVELPSRVQCVRPHAELPLLYVACADRSPDADGDPYYAVVVRVGADGALTVVGEPTPLPARPIDITTDAGSSHLLTAYSSAPGLTVHTLAGDGAIGAQVPMPPDLDHGGSPHQVQVCASGERAVITARGSKPYGTPKYKPGALKVLAYDAGHVANLYSVAPAEDSGLPGFNPRQVAFHPTLPTAYLSLEGQNMLTVLAVDGEDIGAEPLWTLDLLQDREHVMPRQDGGALRLHPNGKFLYIANRNDGVRDPKQPSWLSPDPVPVFPGGENSVLVFALDEATGEPVLRQRIDSGGLHPRTITMDPAGRVLVTGNMAPMRVGEPGGVRDVPAGLGVFRIAADGTLALVRVVPIDVGPEILAWVGVVDR